MPNRIRSLVIEPTHCAVQDIVGSVIEQLNTLSSKERAAFVVQEAELVFRRTVRARQILFNPYCQCDQVHDTGLSGWW